MSQDLKSPDKKLKQSLFGDLTVKKLRKKESSMYIDSANKKYPII